MTSILLLSVQKVFACIFANFSSRVPNDLSWQRGLAFGPREASGVSPLFCSMFIAFLSWEVFKTFWRPGMFSFSLAVSLSFDACRYGVPGQQKLFYFP